MRVLVACEESQEVCNAFRANGHEAYSCDIQPCSGGHPEWHLQVDVLEILKLNWDMIIAFPPCTYMTTAGAVRMYAGGELQQDRLDKAIKAKAFFMRFMDADCPRVAIENPTPLKVVGLPQCDQVIQPYDFGDPYSKRTCLWLKGLPPLFATEIMADYRPYVWGGSKDSYGNPRKRQGFVHDSKERSKTFPGIARAMAEQWGGLEDDE